MKVTSKLITVVALCVGLVQVVAAATVRIQVIKTDPKTRKSRWSYQVRSKRAENSTVSTTQSKTFLRDTKVAINDSNFENVLRVYTNSTGASGTYGEPQYKELNLTSSMLQSLKEKDAKGVETHAVAVEKDATMLVLPRAEIDKLLAFVPTASLEKRKIKVQKTGDNADTWTVQAYTADAQGKKTQYSSVKLVGSKGWSTLSIPKTGPFSVKVSKKNNVYLILTFDKDQAAKLTDLKLNDEGQQATEVLVF